MKNPQNHENKQKYLINTRKKMKKIQIKRKIIHFLSFIIIKTL